MKNFLLLLIIASFSFMMANAQVEKYTWTDTYSDCVWIPCTDDWACGEITFTHTYWWNADGYTTKAQHKVKGELEGELGVYTISQVINDMWWGDPNQVGAAPNTYVLTVSYELDGMPIGVEHWTFHYTWNANGELTTVIDNYVFECY